MLSLEVFLVVKGVTVVLVDCVSDVVLLVADDGLVFWMVVLPSGFPLLVIEEPMCMKAQMKYIHNLYQQTHNV